MYADGIGIFHPDGIHAEERRTRHGAEMIAFFQQRQGGSRIDTLQDQGIPVLRLPVQGNDAAETALQPGVGRSAGNKGHS